ncbi:MAG: PocR ligand-binding domain-containing protein [Desulfotignum sp.]|nr:PocR ligand-binding domain-containing protein [Desulfotignum sp.]MCF8112752.1 PocR ligand-binding domain-containing protein [Desulfotignum sp.]
MTLLDICPVETWEALEQELFEKFNFQGSVFTPDGVRITKVKNFSNQLCPAIKSTEKGQTFICSTAHMNMAAMAENARKPVVEECDAGLIKLVVPIFHKDEFIGVAGGCGLLARDGEVDTFAVSKTADMDEAHVADLAGSVPQVSDKTIAAAKDFIQDRITSVMASCRQKS